eukprot:2886445-Pyramimonas_sp.AAC.2
MEEHKAAPEGAVCFYANLVAIAPTGEVLPLGSIIVGLRMVVLNLVAVAPTGEVLPGPLDR